jgi:uncharacterized protein (TIGR00369 family)
VPEHIEFPSRPSELAAWLTEQSAPCLPGLLGIEIVDLEPDRCVLRLAIEQHHLAPNGYLHAATLIAMADTACGYGSLASRPDGATGFTTIESKSNHVGTLLEGGLRGEATMLHGGRTTQVWDALVTAEGTGRTLLAFRCTQLLLYPG